MTGFFDSDLIFYNGTEQLEVTLKHALRINTYNEESYLLDYTGDYESYSGLYTTSRGLASGMTIGDYVDLYHFEEGYAVWEVYSGDNGEYTGFVAYNDEPDVGDLYDDYLNVWLDIGYCREDGEWRALEDWEIKDIWFCDAYLDDYDEVVILSVNINSDNQIDDISFEHFSYDSDWVTWQDWME
jgi:hypothetical protein